jgi:uncharacterized phage protein (TIGR01671 family)
MRTIKFRAKPLDESYGLIYFDLHESQASGDSEVFYVRNIACESGTEQEFTGLPDKNCKEIYEGDTVKSEFGFIGIIEYEIKNHRSGFRIKWDDGDICDLFIDAAHGEIEIIGNIFENPELLK